MPRPKLSRRVDNPPLFKGYRTIGNTGNDHAVVLNIEEYEAIRLSDYMLYGQHAAADEMGVSRSTYARIYESARRKVSEAFVEGRPIVFEGGKVHFNSEWYICGDCSSLFNHPDKANSDVKCALCSSGKVSQFSDDKSVRNGRKRGECRGRCNEKKGITFNQ